MNEGGGAGRLSRQGWGCGVVSRAKDQHGERTKSGQCRPQSRRSAVLDRMLSYRVRVIRPATIHRVLNSRCVTSPLKTARTSDVSSNRASIRHSSSGSTHRRRKPAPRHCHCSCRPSARAAADGWQYRPFARHHALPRWSTRARYPSDGQPYHPCWLFRAAWRGPLTQIHDLPWPRCPPPVARVLVPWGSNPQRV